MRGYNIREILKAQDHTQNWLAMQTGLSQSMISAIINGAETTESTLSAIAIALGVSIDKISEKTTQELNRCPRCGSQALIEWNNHGSGSCRIRCAYCEADTGEQKDRAHALRMLASFESFAERKEKAQVYVLSLFELLDSSCADADDVRPVWFENRGLFIVPALVQYGRAERELEIVKVLWFGEMSAKSYMLNLYGESWRCWNKKPTAERADAERWSWDDIVER